MRSRVPDLFDSGKARRGRGGEVEVGSPQGESKVPHLSHQYKHVVEIRGKTDGIGVLIPG